MSATPEFKLTYSTMFDPPPELHARFDAALAAIRRDLGAEHPMLIAAATSRARLSAQPIDPGAARPLPGGRRRRHGRSREIGVSGLAACRGPARGVSASRR
jgi:hypothetical protein